MDLAGKAIFRAAKGSLYRLRIPMAPLAAIARNHHRHPFATPVIATVRWHGGPTVPPDAPTVTVTFIDPSVSSSSDDAGGGKSGRLSVSARVGETLLQTAHRHKIPVEGACEGVCACSTCHVILPDDLYDSLIDAGNEPTEDEEDMLDMAPGLTPTSRLGCQVKVTSDMDGVEIELPAMTRNFYVDGHVPEPH